jgi:hypothetical protein
MAYGKTLFIMALAQVIIGGLAVAAFYGAVPGYPYVYMTALAVALIAGITAFRKLTDPDFRGSAGCVVSSSVIYWVLGGASLPLWANSVALISAVALALFGCVSLYRAASLPASGN